MTKQKNNQKTNNQIIKTNIMRSKHIEIFFM